MFRIVWYQGILPSDRALEALADREAAWELWYLLREKSGMEVRVFGIDGSAQHPEHGINGLVGSTPGFARKAKT